MIKAKIERKKCVISHDFDVGAYTFVNNNDDAIADFSLTKECNFSCLIDFSKHSSLK